MLAKRRELLFQGRVVERTPLLVPSFSSKGFPDVAETIRTASEVIEGPTLISAYDLHYSRISPPFDFASLIFLDSGGYEASKERDLSDLSDDDYTPREWTREFHREVVSAWKSSVPTVLISYDNPNDRIPFQEQIRFARDLAPGRNDVLRELLLKPETKKQQRLDISRILDCVHDFSHFDVVGVTEKEVGNSILSRMTNIARIRKAMTEAGINVPIHVFGSLDTVTTPMYFLAGADIFDGLTWLRYAYRQGYTIYKHNYGATDLGINIGAHVIDGRCWFHNYGYLADMQLEMRRFLNGGDFTAFKYHSELFSQAIRSVQEVLGD